jgi:hypothetical protein
MAERIFPSKYIPIVSDIQEWSVPMTILLIGLTIVVNVLAGDMTGVWTFNMNDFSGHPTEYDCTFKQEGTELTGKCGHDEHDAVKITGTVKGSKVNFQYQTGRKNEITAHYAGDLDRAATTLKGKWRVVNPEDGKEMSDDFTAVKR